MARQCDNCSAVLYLASLKEENGIKFLVCPSCGCKQIFRKEREEHIEYQQRNYRPLQICG